jgi:hypothetical protein
LRGVTRPLLVLAFANAASFKERRFATAVFLVGDFKSPLLEAGRYAVLKPRLRLWLTSKSRK